MKENIKKWMKTNKPAAGIILVFILFSAVVSIWWATDVKTEKPYITEEKIKLTDSTNNKVTEINQTSTSGIDKIKVGDSVDYVHETLGEPAGQLSGLWGDIYGLESGGQVIIYYDSNGNVEQIKHSAEESRELNLNDKKLTLDDILIFSQKGEALTFEDFKGFGGADVSSNTNYHIMLYAVEEDYRLIVGTDGNSIDRAELQRKWDKNTGGIDIRYEDPAEFVKRYPPRKAEGLEPVSPKLSPTQITGVDMAELDYASDDIVIFHGYFGLFVYDIHTQQISRSLDLKTIGCADTQGDNYCEVTVSPDGNTVLLHPVSSENMYAYTVSEHTLQETSFEARSDSFNNFVPIDTVVDSSVLGGCSYFAVEFDSGEYGYLFSSDETLDTLSYIREDTVYRLFDKYDWEE